MQRRTAVLMSVVLAASACSGGDADPDDTPAAPPQSDVEVTTNIEEGAIEPVGSGSGSGSTGDFCAAITAIRSAEFELEETFGPEARRLFTDVQSGAPPEIADDVATVIDTLEEIAAVGISTDENDPEALDAAFEILLDPDFTEANENLEEFTSEACGIDLGDGDEADLELGDLRGYDEVDPLSE